MRPFEWKPEYSVSISKFDHQHKQLFSLAESLHDAMLAGREREVLARLLGDLITYTKLHFAAEENLLSHHHYPELEHHRFEHAQLMLKVANYQKRLDSGEVQFTIELMDFLQRWIVNHVLQTDTRYGSYLNKLGVY
jgi:hemerythrin